MEEQNNFTPEVKTKSHTPIYIWIIITVLTLGLLGISGAYAWQMIQYKGTTQNLKTKVSSLENNIATLQQEKVELNTNLQNKEEESQKTTSISSTDPLFYSLDGIPATVTKDLVPFDYTSEGLKSLESDCETTHPTNYFDNLISTFQGTNKIVYNFNFNGDAQGMHYKLTVLPNKIGYKTLSEFKNDFDTCASGGQYAMRINSKWLVLENNCVDDNYDGIAKSKVDCTPMREKLISTLEFN